MTLLPEASSEGGRLSLRTALDATRSGCLAVEEMEELLEEGRGRSRLWLAGEAKAEG
jgi:hypothetical protein